ncbi:Nn.00g022620.m01.CDS01 [Neocucurbitaria sp. VM-36]
MSELYYEPLEGHSYYIHAITYLANIYTPQTFVLSNNSNATYPILITLPMVPLRYEPIRFPRETRHLAVLRNSTSQIRYILEQRELADHRDYTALSYMWGTSTPMHSFEIDGEKLEIGQNLFDFLRTYETLGWVDDRLQYLWIDQICINLSDLGERNCQVSIMNRIFKMAKRGVVWLGLDSDMVEAARQLRDNERTGDWAIATILRNPYFSRVWIVQEVTLAENIRVVCGEIILTLHHLQAASTRLPMSRNWTVPAAALAVIKESRSSRSLEQCIYRYCQNDSKDPRDKIYGLLGMTSERWRVQVDHEKSVIEVYLDAVTALYEELFDRLDPSCFYPTTIRRLDLVLYRDTFLKLGRVMGLP